MRVVSRSYQYFQCCIYKTNTIHNTILQGINCLIFSRVCFVSIKSDFKNLLREVTGVNIKESMQNGYTRKELDMLCCAHTEWMRGAFLNGEWHEWSTYDEDCHT